jgi:Fur family ferric uptake transcriptional regulator
MTVAPHRAPIALASLEEGLEVLRREGGRVTTPRRIVLEALFAADGPVSAEHIAQGQGERPSLELTSVYRNLQYLEELGIVRHVHAGHGAGLYALETLTPLEYVVCEHCDRVEAIDAPRLDRARAEIRSELGFEVRFSHFPLVGLCPRCAAGSSR